LSGFHKLYGINDLMALLTELNRIRRMMANASSFQWNEFLLRENVLERLEASPELDLKASVAQLAKRFAAWTQPEQTNEAAQLFEEYGEAYCLLELKVRGMKKGCVVTRLSAGGRAKRGLKTPDIHCTGPDSDFFIEIKVLDMVGGQSAAKQLVTESFENAVELDARLKPGVNFGKPLELAPLGRHGRHRTHAENIDDYIRRISGNIKKKQLTVGPTFLLVVDMRVPLNCYSPSCLVPTYFQQAPYPSPDFPGECVSGDWWQVGFGRTGNLVLGRSEFEGKGNLQGYQRADGILVDHPYLFGLSVFTHEMHDRDVRIHTLAQSDRMNLPTEETFDAFDPGDTAWLFSDAYNDAHNSYGFRYQLQT
jgi:hypothetical protein